MLALRQRSETRRCSSGGPWFEQRAQVRSRSPEQARISILGQRAILRDRSIDSLEAKPEIQGKIRAEAPRVLTVKANLSLTEPLNVVVKPIAGARFIER